VSGCARRERVCPSATRTLARCTRSVDCQCELTGHRTGELQGHRTVELTGHRTGTPHRGAAPADPRAAAPANSRDTAPGNSRDTAPGSRAGGPTTRRASELPTRRASELPTRRASELPTRRAASRCSDPHRWYNVRVYGAREMPPPSEMPASGITAHAGHRGAWQRRWGTTRHASTGGNERWG
jgi:hypothetical protein